MHKSTLAPFKNEAEWLQAVSESFGGTIIDHHVDIPEDSGKGFFAARQLEEGLSVRYVEAVFNKDIEYYRPARKKKDQLMLSFQFRDIEYSDQPNAKPDSFIKLNKGSIVVFSSNTHTSIRMKAHKEVNIFTIDLSLTWLKERLGIFLAKDKEVNELIFSDQKIVYFEPMKYRYLPVFQEIFANDFDPDIAPLMLHAKTEELIYLFFDQLYRNLHRSVAPAHNITADDQHRIQELLEYIEEHLDDSLEVDALSRRAGFSKSKLQRLFQHIIGQPVYAYIKRLRMETASRLLRTTDDSVTQIALGVGYHSDTHFINVFKKYHGISPKQFQLRYREEEMTL